MSGCPGAASPAGPSEESGSAEWRRIYDRVEKLAADRARLEEINRTQQELSEAREKSLQARLLQAEASRVRWKTAYIELPLLANPKIIELQEIDLKDYRTCEDDDNSQLKEARTGAELRQNNENHEGIVGDLRAELRKLKQAYKTLSTNKDKEISGLLGVKAFLWNKLRTIEKENIALLKIKEVEAAQATETAEKLQHNIEEMQVAAQKFQQNIEGMEVAARKKDDMVGRLQAKAGNAKQRVLTLDGKLLEMHSLIKEKNDEIQKLKKGQPESLKLKCASPVSNEVSQDCSKDIDETMELEEYMTSQECSKDIDEMDLDLYTIFVKILDGKTITLKVKQKDTIFDVKAKIQDKEGIPACHHRLMFDDELLVGSCTLDRFEIEEEPTFRLVLQGMHVFVKTPRFPFSRKVKMTLEVENADTVYRVKAKIFYETGFAPEMQRLQSLAGKVLKEACTLAEYNIQNDSQVYLKLHEGYLISSRINLWVSTGAHTIIDRRVMPSETVGDIKETIYVELGIPTDQQCLYLDGKPLDDVCTVKEAQDPCVTACYLWLQLRLPGGE